MSSHDEKVKRLRREALALAEDPEVQRSKVLRHMVKVEVLEQGISGFVEFRRLEPTDD